MKTVEEKLRDVFGQMVVYKDLRNASSMTALGLPSFTRDWLLACCVDDEGRPDYERIANFRNDYIPHSKEWEWIKARIVKDYEVVRFLAKIKIDVDVKSGEATFELPDYKVASKETIIEDDVWFRYKDQLKAGDELWGFLALGYRYPDDDSSPKKKGKLKLVEFQSFRPYPEIDPDFYKDARAEFTFDEWIDLLLSAIDYNPAGFGTLEQKLAILTRLLPFAEKRLNLIELAPKGTGKSTLYGQVSRYGWLSSGGVITRAKLFYDLSRREEGLVAHNDFVVLDEAQTISFGNDAELKGALKGYMEQGVFRVGNHEGRASSGIVVSGNISQEAMDNDRTVNVFKELPAFNESALVDRFHGFLRGREIPRLTNDMKCCGWALSSEYFCSMLHELRDDGSYRAIVDQLIVVPPGAEIRDTEAVKRIATAYLKLFFPNVRAPEDVELELFKRYCLDRAVAMRELIKIQLGHIAPAEFAGKKMPVFALRDPRAIEYDPDAPGDDDAN